ncbi:SUR7-domain-containing protein [Suhomyces tanzawaensis NRRL Y-17324]|uniref:SUR7-domain-containing protein n=1 Tax=Suhomyces tanzawaensis NRRL Y-17324 TaxID=984487 RepID=A0A1E4SHW9_9ASCO|nr:SUR7-domain-containing protein [Suhomyces tanzawaensis NRRL Y-17324]ODV79095.1 SUR7-domain-containing protein [Suhomyces tanzawaensis NRRL Y-17324]
MLRRLITLIPIIFLLGSALLLFFLNLCGANTSSVLGEFYWSQTDTSGIPSANRDLTRWTLYNTCGVQNGRNVQCDSAAPAFPYSPVDNFGGSSGLPSTFSSSRSTFFYSTRIAYAFLLIGLVFSVVAVLFVLLSCCLSGHISGILSAIVVLISFVFTVIAASLLTAAHARGKNAFNNAGHSSRLGVKMFALLWTTVALQLLSFFTLIFTSSYSRWSKRKHYEEPYTSDKLSSNYSG